MGTLKTFAVVVFLFGLSGCDHARRSDRTLMCRQATVVMAKPYPHWYRGTKNEVLTVMHVGQTLAVRRFSTAKDFAIYEVLLPDGRVGYVEYDPARVKEVVSHTRRPTS